MSIESGSSVSQIWTSKPVRAALVRFLTPFRTSFSEALTAPLSVTLGEVETSFSIQLLRLHHTRLLVSVFPAVVEPDIEALQASQTTLQCKQTEVRLRIAIRTITTSDTLTAPTVLRRRLQL